MFGLKCQFILPGFGINHIFFRLADELPIFNATYSLFFFILIDRSDASQSNLRSSAYEAVMELIKNSPKVMMASL